MRKKAVEQLSSVIRANTERRSLEELKAAGKKHVRVVSGEKVMQLIQAVVEDAIAREANEKVAKDRDQIVANTRREFDRVMKFQAEQEAEVRRLRELEAHHHKRAETAEDRMKLLSERLEEALEQVEGNEARTGRLEAYLAEARNRYEAGEGERERARKITESALERCLNAEASLEGVKERLNTASGTIANYDQEFERVAHDREAEQREFAAEVEGHLLQMRALEAEVARLIAELEGREEEIDELRAQAAPQHLDELKGEMSQIRELVHSLADRPAGADPTTLEALVDRIGARESERATELEERFSLQMERALDEVARTLRSATAKPVEIAVEATDVLVDRIWDHESDMKTNLDALSVEELDSKRKISSNLARLRRAQEGREGDR